MRNRAILVLGLFLIVTAGAASTMREPASSVPAPMPDVAKDPDCIANCWRTYQDCIYENCLGGMEWSEAEFLCNAKRQQCDDGCPPLFNPDGTPFHPKKS